MCNNNFGKGIRQARMDKGYSQRDLARLTGVSYTYISKIKNGRTAYPPSEEFFQNMEKHLGLDFADLSFQAGRISPDDDEIFRALMVKYKQMPILLHRMLNNPIFAKNIFEQISE